MHYLDNSATTRVLPEAAEAAMQAMLNGFGNPSSQHSLGIAAARQLKACREAVAAALGAQPNELTFTSGGTEAINTAIFGAQHSLGIAAARQLKACREAVAAALGAQPNELTFTSGGTEAINTAIFGAAFKNRHFGKHIITTAIEHAATKNAAARLEAEGYEVTYLQPDAEGHIALEDFAAALREDTVLASVMLVNNEVGTVLPVAEMGRLLSRKCPKALFHVDAVQGLFRIPLTPKKWNCHLLSVSGHKIGAPKGIGALYMQKGVNLRPYLVGGGQESGMRSGTEPLPNIAASGHKIGAPKGIGALYMQKGVNLRPYLVGGGQESGMRSGTEPLPNIAAFAEACRIRMRGMDADVQHVAELSAYLRAQVAAELPWAQWNGSADVPHVANLSLPGCKSEVMLRVLESDEVYVSAGSACAKGRESAVLKAMGLDKKRIDSALRISFAPFNTKEDVDALIAALKKGAAMLKR